MAIRVAVTGRTATPPLFDTLVALGATARSSGDCDRAAGTDRRTPMRREDVTRSGSTATSRLGELRRDAIGDLFARTPVRYQPWATGRRPTASSRLARDRTTGPVGRALRAVAVDGERVDAIGEPAIEPDGSPRSTTTTSRCASTGMAVRRLRRVLHGAPELREPLARPSPRPLRQRAVNTRRIMTADGTNDPRRRRRADPARDARRRARGGRIPGRGGGRRARGPRRSAPSARTSSCST